MLRVRDHMVKRGPDGHGVWISADQRIGLAHRRLAIIDLSAAGAQPMATADQSLRIIFNGEIYNYRALRLELEAQGHDFRSTSDTEVLLHLYQRDGEAMLSRLRGMFAFVIWDEARQSIFAARDHFGIKPLYIADDGATIRFASQVKALLAGGAIATDANPAAQAGFFLWGHVPEPHTLYRAIRPLPPGSWLSIDRAGQRRSGRYFTLTEELAHPPARPHSDLREALIDSIHAHLEADVDVGVFLSSGLDSTTLLGLAAEAAGTPPKSVTLRFAEFIGDPRDETPLAATAARLFQSNHAIVDVGAADFTAQRQQILCDMDQPSIDGVNTWFVARAARQSGLKVALSGVGGDELFGGYASFHQIPKLLRTLGPLARLPVAGPLAGKAWRLATAPWIGRLTSTKTAGLLEYARSLEDAFVLRRALVMPWELKHFLDPDTVIEGLRQLALPARLSQACQGLKSERQKISALETQIYMQGQLLRDTDWAGMAHSLEIRTPLVDIELFRLVAGLAAAGTAPNKQAMAACSHPPLPPTILNRAKTGFFVPVPQWLGETNLRGWARAVFQAFTHA